MCRKLFAFLMIIIALLVAAFAVGWPKASFTGVFFISHFFDVMLPILAVAALIKYLLTCPAGYKHSAKCCKKDASAPTENT